MITCATMDDADWIAHRFSGRCYFYPARDCPGWKPGTRCGRVDNQIPADAEVSDVAG